VWNAWKGKLLEDLFRSTRRVLRGETDYAASWIARKKARALRIFRQYVPEPGKHEALWKHLDDNYFQRFEASEIAWHTRTLVAASQPDKPIVRARLSPVGEGLQVLVYAPDQPGLFARITGFFERMQFDVAAAEDLHHAARLRAGQLPGALAHALRRALPRAYPADSSRSLPSSSRRSCRSSRRRAGAYRAGSSTSRFEPAGGDAPDRRPGPLARDGELRADRPGLLSAIARVLLNNALNLIDARVTTLGLRAEDAFVVVWRGARDAASRERIADELRAIAVT
jgi:[protein-PII] uridylyltransferase